MVRTQRLNLQGIGLYDVVQNLKEDIRRLEEEPVGGYMFEIENAEIELSVAVKKEAGGGINIWVINVGGKVKKEDIHKVRINLKPYVQESGEQNHMPVTPSDSSQQLSDVIENQSSGRSVSRKIKAKRVRARR